MIRMTLFLLLLATAKQLSFADVNDDSCERDGVELSPERYNNLPDQIILTQSLFHLIPTFSIKTKTENLGRLSRAIRLFPEYEFYDDSNHLVATSQTSLLSINNHIDVMDNKKNQIGAIENKLLSILPVYFILSHSGEQLVRAERDLWGRCINAYDIKQGQIVAEMCKSFGLFKSDWTIDIKNKDFLQSQKMDPLLLVIMLISHIESESKDANRRNKGNAY